MYAKRSPLELHIAINHIDPLDPQLLESVCEVIRDSQYPATHLEIGCESLGMYPSRAALLLSGPAFAKLSVLRLSVDEGVSEAKLEETRAIIQDFVAFLKAASNIQTFGLTQARWKGPPHFQ